MTDKDAVLSMLVDTEQARRTRRCPFGSAEPCGLKCDPDAVVFFCGACGCGGDALRWTELLPRAATAQQFVHVWTDTDAEIEQFKDLHRIHANNE